MLVHDGARAREVLHLPPRERQVLLEGVHQLRLRALLRLGVLNGISILAIKQIVLKTLGDSRG